MPKFLWLLKPLKLKNLHLKPFDIVRGTRVSLFLLLPNGQNRQKKNNLKEGVFVNSALNLQCHIGKNTLLRTAFSAILPTGFIKQPKSNAKMRGILTTTQRPLTPFKIFQFTSHLFQTFYKFTNSLILTQVHK